MARCRSAICWTRSSMIERRAQHRLDRVHRMRGDVQGGRTRGLSMRRRDRVRERHCRDERVGELRQDPDRRRHHRHGRPADRRCGGRRAGRADRGRRRPVSRHQARRLLARRAPTSRTTGPTRPRACCCATIFARASSISAPASSASRSGAPTPRSGRHQPRQGVPGYDDRARPFRRSDRHRSLCGQAGRGVRASGRRRSTSWRAARTWWQSSAA